MHTLNYLHTFLHNRRNDSKCKMFYIAKLLYNFEIDVKLFFIAITGKCLIFFSLRFWNTVDLFTLPHYAPYIDGFVCFLQVWLCEVCNPQEKGPKWAGIKTTSNKGLLGLRDDGVKSTGSETPRSKKHYKLGLCVSPLLHKVFYPSAI